MKKKYRDRNYLLASILQSAGSFPGEYKTKILMKSEMNYSQIRRYFNYLKANGLLIQDSNSKRWYRTAKGEALLELYNKMKDTAKEI